MRMKSLLVAIPERRFGWTIPPYPGSTPCSAGSMASIPLSAAGSLNGTYVNRQRVDQAVLKNGDEIMIGKFRLVFFTKSAFVSQ